MENRLYAADCTVLLQPAQYERAYRSVSPARQVRADRFRFASDRSLCVGAELLLRFALRSAGLEAEEPVFIKGHWGKPELLGAPGIQFNISHSGRFVLCALSDSPVGCDIEKHHRAEPGQVRRFFSPEECRYIDSAEDPVQAFYRIWTLRESYTKALGLGLSLRLEDYRIDPAPSPAVIRGGICQDWRFQEFSVHENYSAALCTRSREDFTFETADILQTIP